MSVPSSPITASKLPLIKSYKQLHAGEEKIQKVRTRKLALKLLKKQHMMVIQQNRKISKTRKAILAFSKLHPKKAKELRVRDRVSDPTIIDVMEKWKEILTLETAAVKL